ncbi:MAG: MFS transporter [Armatimonadia bacterium]
MELTVAKPPEDADLLPPRPLGHHLALTIYWLSNSLLWGALLHLGLQSRLSDWFGQAHIGYYIGILGAVGGIVGTATQMIVGAFSDRSMHPWGRRRPFLMAGVMLAVGALTLLGAARSFWPFAGALILVQLFSNAALGPFTALLPDTVNPREHGKASGFMGVARLLGDVGGLILAGRLLSTGHLGLSPAQAVLIAFHDHRFMLMCLYMAGFMLLTMIVCVLTIKEKRLHERPALSPLQTVIGSFNVDVRGNVDFFWLSLSRAITNLGFYMFLEVLFFFLKYSLRVPDAEHASMMLMLPAIGAAILSSVPSGILSDRLGRRNMIFIAQFLMAIACGIFVFAPNLTWAYIAGIPAGLAYGVFTAVEWALACNLLPKAEAARYLGVWNASAVVPQILAFPLGGAVGSAISAAIPGLGWRVDFAITVVCCLVGAWFLKFVHERRRERSTEECPSPVVP